MSSRAHHLFVLVHVLLAKCFGIVVFFVLFFWTIRCCRPRCKSEVGVDKKRSVLRKLFFLENAGDGLLACPGVGPKISSVISGSIIILALAPGCVLLICYFWGSLIALAGSWQFVEAFWVVMYCLGFMENPLYPNAASTSVAEDIQFLACSLLALVQVNFVLTLISTLNLPRLIIESFRQSIVFNLCMLFLLLPLLLLAVNCLASVPLSLSEEISFHEALFFILNWTSAGGNWPVQAQTKKAHTDLGALVVIYVTALVVPIDGIIIGLIGGLPCITQITNFLEGEALPESSEVHQVVGNSEFTDVFDGATRPGMVGSGEGLDERQRQCLERNGTARMASKKDSHSSICEIEEFPSKQQLMAKVVDLTDKLRQTERQVNVLLSNLGFKDLAEAQHLFDMQKLHADSMEIRDLASVNDHSNAAPVANTPHSNAPRAMLSERLPVRVDFQGGRTFV